MHARTVRAVQREARAAQRADQRRALAEAQRVPQHSGPPDVARHVIHRMSNPHFLSQLASNDGDLASNVARNVIHRVFQPSFLESTGIP